MTPFDRPPTSHYWTAIFHQSPIHIHIVVLVLPTPLQVASFSNSLMNKKIFSPPIQFTIWMFVNPKIWTNFRILSSLTCSMDAPPFFTGGAPSLLAPSGPQQIWYIIITSAQEAGIHHIQMIQRGRMIQMQGKKYIRVSLRRAGGRTEANKLRIKIVPRLGSIIGHSMTCGTW